MGAVIVKTEDLKTLPPWAQHVVMEIWKMADEMSSLRVEVVRLRRAITDELE